MRFWDSSALVPLVVREPESPPCADLYREDADVLVWALTPVEIFSALYRRNREGVLEDERLATAIGALEQLRRNWSEVLDVELVRLRAERVISVHGVRAADALQLAAALVASGEQPRHIPLVSLDQRLRAAARSEGFTVLPD